MTTGIIEFSNVTKTFRKHFWTPKKCAVSDCSFRVEKNTITGFVGPNGAGKTTSIKMILGLCRPSRGSIRINGMEPENPASRKGVAYLSERPYFYDHLTVAETLRFALRLNGSPNSSSTTAIDSALDKVELKHVSSFRVKDLSKGMQQRLSMAQALVIDPDLYILDEPMSGLDPLGRRLFRSLFASLAQQGKSVFFSTHILDDVESLCENVIVLSQGKLSYQGSVSHLLADGFTGTDITVSQLSIDMQAGLSALGYSIAPLGEKHVIFVPATHDLKKCQQYLSDHAIFCDSIVRRNASLEDIVYNKDKGAAHENA